MFWLVRIEDNRVEEDALLRRREHFVPSLAAVGGLEELRLALLGRTGGHHDCFVVGPRLDAAKVQRFGCFRKSALGPVFASVGGSKHGTTRSGSPSNLI